MPRVSSLGQSQILDSNFNPQCESTATAETLLNTYEKHWVYHRDRMLIIVFNFAKDLTQNSPGRAAFFKKRNR